MTDKELLAKVTDNIIQILQVWGYDDIDRVNIITYQPYREMFIEELQKKMGVMEQLDKVCRETIEMLKNMKS